MLDSLAQGRWNAMALEAIHATISANDALLAHEKNLVEYEARLFTAKEAQEAVKHAERFLEWVRAKR